MTDYTPTTDEVRKAVLCSCGSTSVDGFDRWLAAHDKEVRADEREKAAERVDMAIRKVGGYFIAFAAVRGDGEQA